MKKLAPLLLALLGLGAGLGAGLMLKPAPEAAQPPSACVAEPAEAGRGHGEARRARAARPPATSPAEADPFEPVAHAEKKTAAELAYVPMDKPFVVPVFAGEKVVAMVVVSLSVETETEAAPTVEAVKPRLRDSFLKVMFRHANSGGFDGSFTSRPQDGRPEVGAAGRRARGDGAETPVEEVLITEIARQDS